jgi:hypothetical protein
VLQDQIHMRFTSLMHAAQQAARRNATMQASAAADKMDDILQAAGFTTRWPSFWSTCRCSRSPASRAGGPDGA